jgi:hypothetical protein
MAMYLRADNVLYSISVYFGACSFLLQSLLSCLHTMSLYFKTHIYRNKKHLYTKTKLTTLTLRIFKTHSPQRPPNGPFTATHTTLLTSLPLYTLLCIYAIHSW